jgi:hypothetical protein
MDATHEYGISGCSTVWFGKWVPTFLVTCYTENGATGFPETLDQIYCTTRRHIIGDGNIDPYRRVNIKSHLSVAVLKNFHVWLNLSVFGN